MFLSSELSKWQGPTKYSLVVLFLFSLNCLGQPKQFVSFPTPNAASFGIFGQIPVSYFTGLPNISVPLYTFQEDGITMPINLSYHASGVRPDLHGGWVGLGWNLSAGGVITRIANGDIDEKVVDNSISTDHTIKSYFANYGELNDPNWDQPSFLNTLLNNYQTIPAPANSAMAAPDEFAFNFNGYSGSFFLDHTGTWRIRSENGKAIKVSVVSVNPFTLSSNVGSITIQRVIDKIVLVTPDGTTYTFGGTPESIEFSRGAGEHDIFFGQVTASTWHLTNIKTLNGKEINLSYERDGVNIVGSESWNNYYIYNGGSYSNASNGPGNYISYTLLNPSYLTSIVSENQTIAFTRAQTHELTSIGDDWKKFTIEGGNGPSNGYADIPAEDSKYFKLTNMTISRNSDNQEIKSFAFTYKDVATSRLMLETVQERDANENSAIKPYQFFYEDDPSFDLPGYLSRKLDHWGFFNNNNYIASKPPGYTFSPADEAGYTASRDPDPNYATESAYLKEGTLNKIIYPTGGQTVFEYEPNSYSYVAHSYDSTPLFDVTQVGPDGTVKIAGGLRIRKITSSDGHSPNIVKEYFYTTDGPTPNSSGILGGVPKYLNQLYAVSGSSCSGLNGLVCINTGTPVYWYLYSRSILPLSFTSGSHVTYSRVKEVFSDGSYKVYSYTNHDNPVYRDQAAINGVYTGVADLSAISVTDMSYTRGKLLTEETYDAASKPLQKVTYAYNSKPERFDDYIRTAMVTLITPPNLNSLGEIFAYKKYLFEPYVTDVTTDTYNHNDNTFVTQKVTTEYDDQTMLVKKRKELKSDGGSQDNVYRYPGDKAALSPSFSTADLSVVDQMNNYHVIAPVLETLTYKNTTFLSQSSTAYKQITSGSNTFFKPSVDMFRAAGATQDEIQNTFDYDNVGNISIVSAAGVSKSSYIWGYNQTYPIVHVVGAPVNNIYHENFEEGTGNTVLNDSKTGHYSYSGSFAHNLSGLDAGKYTLRYWLKSGANWQLQQSTIAVTGSTYSISLAPGQIDDVCFYPESAQMSTYTYDPLVGMTSATDPKGQTTYYEYDASQRLITVRDQNGKILKNTNYHYKP